MGKKYRLTVNKKQLNIIYRAIEEYFRLRMGQDFDFSNDIASMNTDLSPDNPNHEMIFDHMIHRRDDLSEVMKCFFRIAFAPYGYVPEKKTPEMLIAEDIWEAIRVNKGMQTYPLYLSGEPIMEIETIEGDNNED